MEVLPVHPPPVSPLPVLPLMVLQAASPALLLMFIFYVVAVAAPAGLGRVLISLVERGVAVVRMFLVVLAAKSAATFKIFQAFCEAVSIRS